VAITRDEVRRVAALARLHLSADEEARLAGDLDHILSAFATLQALDTTGLEPMRPVDIADAPLRPDGAVNPPAADALLEQAPDRQGRLFHVPRIIE
jgi:aspartyl-tRNA(Asn)/glutamyl-tRNA(Gln) amidotransferase subunit C